MAIASLDHHLEATPGVCGGKVRIAGRRITVHDVAVWHERLGMTPEEIVSSYELSFGDVYAALAYYFDHQEAITHELAQGQALVDAVKKATPSKLEAKLREQKD